ncbi:MAG: hypothetical protein HY402_03320, partial [Elusimicrobia bacterium]|nr:hypothetical protein [Elusimicrobiota bacterium]
MRKAAAGALLCLCLAGAAPGRAQEKNSLLRPLGVVALDGWHLLSSPLRIRSSHLPALATAGLATGATYAQDGSVRRRVAEDPGAWGRGAADELSNFVRFKPVLLYNASLIGLGAGWRYLHPDSRLLSAAWVSLEAQMFSALFTQGIKGFTGRQRPNPEISGSRNLRFFRGGQSFSSGHAAWAFSTASVFAYQYGAPVGWLAYGTA